MGGKSVGGTTAPCASPKIINARWATATVKCGDNAQMLADTQNIPANTAAVFTVKKTSDSSSITTANSNTAAASVNGTWVSQKPSDHWNGADAKFTVAAAGVQADSQDPQLSFHRYPDIAQASLSGHVVSPPGSSSPRFGWDEKVLIEFTNRKLTLTVKVHLINRTQPRPEKGKKESYGDYYTRCDATPTGGPVPADAKQSIKNAVETIYRNKLDLHRQACQRGNGCNCSRNNLCCKFETVVRLELVDTSGTMIHEVNLWPQSGRADSSNWYRIESRPGKSWAHEVGHLMGFYDEYTEGATGNAPWVPSAPGNIMGSGTGVPDYYFEEFRTWFTGQSGETFNLISHT